MILVKPKTNTLLSLGVFIILCLAGGTYGLIGILRDVHASWYMYIMALVLLPLGIILLFRMLWSYKHVRIGKQKILVTYPVRMVSHQKTLKMIHSWKEEKVKTASGTYKEVHIRFTDDYKITLSLQEHQNYIRTLQYLRKKCSKKQITP